jgi:GNAT superfamily N-acetyltransferase
MKEPEPGPMIEEASPGDAEDILSVIDTSNREAFRCIIPQEQLKAPIRSLQELRGLMKTSSFYLYRSENRAVGVAALSPDSRETGLLQWVYILPEFQRKGLGRALVGYVEGIARKKGLKTLRLTTAGTAIWAIEFYHQLGYTIAGKIDRPAGFDVLMERTLIEETS